MLSFIFRKVLFPLTAVIATVCTIVAIGVGVGLVPVIPLLTLTTISSAAVSFVSTMASSMPSWAQLLLLAKSNLPLAMSLGYFAVLLSALAIGLTYRAGEYIYNKCANFLSTVKSLIPNNFGELKQVFSLQAWRYYFRSTSTIEQVIQNGNLPELQRMMSYYQIRRMFVPNNRAIRMAALGDRLDVVNYLLQDSEVRSKITQNDNEVLRNAYTSGHWVIVGRLLEIAIVRDSASRSSNWDTRNLVRAYRERLQRERTERENLDNVFQLPPVRPMGNLNLVNRLPEIPEVINGIPNYINANFYGNIYHQPNANWAARQPLVRQNAFVIGRQGQFNLNIPIPPLPPREPDVAEDALRRIVNNNESSMRALDAEQQASLDIIIAKYKNKFEAMGGIDGVLEDYQNYVITEYDKNPVTSQEPFYLYIHGVSQPGLHTKIPLDLSQEDIDQFPRDIQINLYKDIFHTVHRFLFGQTRADIGEDILEQLAYLWINASDPSLVPKEGATKESIMVMFTLDVYFGARGHNSDEERIKIDVRGRRIIEHYDDLGPDNKSCDGGMLQRMISSLAAMGHPLSEVPEVRVLSYYTVLQSVKLDYLLQEFKQYIQNKTTTELEDAVDNVAMYFGDKSNTAVPLFISEFKASNKTQEDLIIDKLKNWFGGNDRFINNSCAFKFQDQKRTMRYPELVKLICTNPWEFCSEEFIDMINLKINTPSSEAENTVEAPVDTSKSTRLRKTNI